MTTENLAKFTINASPSVDPVTGDKGYQTTALATLTLTLEQVPSAALSVTYYVYSSTDESSPLASKDSPSLTFTASGTYMDSPASPNGTVELVMPATAAHSWNVRCVAATADGSDEYVRQICIPYTLGVTDIFKTVPEETDEFYARGWSDKFNDYLAYIALFSIPTLDVSYDAGGAGLGRVVTVDSGAIEFNGSNAADYTLEVSNSGNGGVLYMDNTGTGRTFDIRIGGVASLVLDGTNNLAATCATLLLEATGAVALSSSAGLLSLSDGFQAGSTYGTDLVLSDASAEWDLFEVNFGEVSILNAFNQCAASAVTLDDAYNASAGASTITVDAGDVTWNEVGAWSFVIGLSGCTGVADGFFVEDGTDYFRLTHAAANTLGLDAALSTVSLSASSTVDIDAAGALSLNSSGAAINVGNDAVAQNLNLGTGGARTIAVGSVAATAITLDAIALSLDASSNSNYSISANDDANTYTLTIAAVNAGAGKAYVDIYSDDETKLRSTAGTVLIDAATNLELNSSGGVINIGHDAVAQAINLGTAGARTITIGNATGATALDLKSGTGGINLHDGVAQLDLNGAGVLTETALVSADLTPSGTLTLRGGGVSQFGDDTGYFNFSGVGALSTTGVTTADLDCSGAMSLNSSAGIINVGNDAVAQNINIGTAGARTIAIGSISASAVNIDANALSLDALNNSNFSLMANAAADKTLTVHSENLGAGDGYLLLTCGDRACVTDQFVNIGAFGTNTSAINLSTDGYISFSGYAAIATNFNDAVDTVLVGFASTSIIGALNELKEGYFALGVYNVVANAYAFNSFAVSVILVDYTATGTCTVTIASAQIAVSGRTFVIKDSGQNAAANNITVETEGAETIEGEANFVINTDGGWLTFVSDGSNLHLI
jgi:hypothetical protein